MPPTPKAVNSRSLDDIYASLDGASPPSEKKGSKKSFSPYGSKPKSAATSPDTNLPSTSFKASPTPPTDDSQDQRIKKSFSPYGQKPKSADTPKVDPSSFSFGAPAPNPSSSQSQASPASTSSFSFGGELSAGEKTMSSSNQSLSPDLPVETPPESAKPQTYGTTSAPKSFVATGFSSIGSSKFGPDDKANSNVVDQDRLKELENARKRAMDIIRDDQQEE